MKQNFKTLACIFAAATIALFAASCKKEMFGGDPEHMPIEGVERTINASATMPQTNEKAYLDYTDDLKVKWELTDALNINGTNLPLASLNADATSARFEGTTYAIPSGSNGIYWAVYPTNIVGAASGSTIPSNFTATSLTVNFPTTQTYNSSANALSGNTYMAGYASVPANEEHIVFQMRNLGAVLKLHLTADASATNKLASRIVFSTTDGDLAGEFEVDNTSDPAVTATVNSTQTLTVNLTDGINNYIDIASGADIYVILPPMDSKNLTMRVYNTAGGMSSKTVSSTTLARRNIYTNTVSDLCFCDNCFSVSATQRVVFGPGNLQWSATNGGSTATTHTVAGGGTAPGTWRFASNQWDYIGNAAGNNTAAASREPQAAWIDLFGWGTSGYDNTVNDTFAINFQPWEISNSHLNTTTYNSFGYGPSTNMADPNIAGSNYDWGVYNAIYNPQTNTTDAPGTWRTPTKDELAYVINTRTTSSGVRYAKATVNNVQGLIIVPDNWDVNTYALNGTNTTNAEYTVNTISSADWTNIFEPAGCAFLPAAGERNGSLVNAVGTFGNYWLAEYCSVSYAYYLLFFSGNVTASYYNVRCYGSSVRLVKNL